MARMAVNEGQGWRGRRRGGLRGAIKRRLRRPRTLITLGSALVLVLIVHFVVMPWVVRGRVRAALDEAGFGSATFRVTSALPWATELRDLVLDKNSVIDRARVKYNVVSLWNREVDEIVLSGATLSADPDKWPVEKKAGASPRATTLPKKAGLQLPFNRLSVYGSTLVLKDGSRIPFEGTLLRGPLEVTYRVSSKEHGLEVLGTIARTFNAGKVAGYLSHARGEVITSLLRTYVDDLPVKFSGRAGGELKVAWDEHGTRATTAFEIAGGSIDKASDAKLILARGVFVGEADIGPATRPTVTAKLRDVDLATPDLTATGVSGAVTLLDLSPPRTAPRQRLGANLLKIGDTEFANGQIEFEVNENGDIFVRQTRWDFLGGQVYANDVQVPQEGPVKMTLRADKVELRDILAAYAKDKLAGTGRISGYLPVTIDGRNITFGEGRLNSLAGGQLKITDPDTLAEVAEVAGAAASSGAGSPQQVKQNIAEALRDFEYDQVTARLTNDPDGLAAYILIKGHGRTGARQALVYEPRIHRLDDVIRLSLDLQRALNQPATGGRPSTRQATTTPATTGKAERNEHE